MEPGSLRYSPSHEWSAEDGDVVTVGISDFAQEQLGDVVFVELPDVGTRFAAGDAVAVVESVKTASDIYAPVSGEVVEVNEALLDAPERINEEPYGAGWIYRLRIADRSELSSLLDADGYAATLEDGA